MSTYTPTGAVSDGQHPSQPQCPNCSAILASDQRYCLNCGQRLAPPRVEYRDALRLRPPDPPVVAASTRWYESRGPLVTLALLCPILLALGVGIVIGRGHGGGSGRPTIVTVPNSSPTAAAASTPGSTPATAVSSQSISETWPAGASGYTVELSSLPTGSATSVSLAAAKSAATAKGAPAVGVLDGSKHSGTPAADYVIYSGRFSSSAQANAARKRLQGKFPGALVLHVTPKRSSQSVTVSSKGLGQAAANQHLSGNAYVKASAKLPSTVGTGGAPPPTDNKKAGGGTSGSCIGC